MTDIDYKKLLEAALFMAPKAMGLDDLSRSTGIASKGKLKEMLSDLISQYDSAETSLRIIEVSGKYMFGIKSPYAEMVKDLAVGPDISRGGLRLLAYISKNDGIMQSQLVKAFGQSTYIYIQELQEKEFIEAKKQGRSRKITLTPKFSEYFEVTNK
jgi:segregation and condensation protein B